MGMEQTFVWGLEDIVGAVGFSLIFTFMVYVIVYDKVSELIRKYKNNKKQGK